MVTETDRNKARSAVVSAYHALDCVTIPFSFLHAFADAAVDAVSTDAEPVAWIVRNPTVARTHSKTQAHKSSKEALYPVSRGEDAREYARLMGGECLPLYTHSLEAEQEENAAEGKCQENDGCPTEKAVLQRFWRRHHNAEPVKTAPAVAVSALRWDKVSSKNSVHYRAQGIFGWLHYIRNTDPDGIETGMWYSEIGTFEKLEDAQAAAQSSYNATINSALSAQVQDVAEGWQLVPIKPTKGMAYAAACAHYGKKRVDQTGIEGISMTVNNIDYNFATAFRRFWKGALAASPASKHGDAE